MFNYLIKKSNLPLILIMVFVIFSSVILNLLPAAYIPGIFKIGTIAHFIDYSILTFIFYIYLYKMKFRYPVSGAFFSILFFSTAIEFLQLFVPNRGFELLDLLANIVGIIFGIVAVKFVLYKIVWQSIKDQY